MRVERSRIHLLMGSLALTVTLATGRRSHAGPGPRPPVTVYKGPT